ncbi:MAG: hypothetical protein JKX69_07315, partial [Rhodobacteraceae bacterium]|nr:hypothetical protein [Paracoccaceae bacterium]
MSQIETAVSQIETVSVPLPGRSYDIIIGPGLLQQAGAYISPLLNRPQVAVITDENVAALHLSSLEAGLAAAGIKMTALILPPGEPTKGWAGLARA